MNFQSLISELQSAGLTQEAIATLVQTRQSTIGDLASGRNTEPRYGLGARLVGLHRRVMRRIKKVA